jgi:hypothetical protein
MYSLIPIKIDMGMGGHGNRPYGRWIASLNIQRGFFLDRRQIG